MLIYLLKEIADAREGTDEQDLSKNQMKRIIWSKRR
jgi:hypothetical protein